VVSEYTLIELAQGVFAWTHTDHRFGNANVGLVIDSDGLTVIDSTATPATGSLVRAEIQSLTAKLELPIKRLVFTGPGVAFTGGGTAFPQPAVYGSDATSDALDLPANPDAFGRLLPHLAASYHPEFATRPVTHTISESAWLTPSLSAAPLRGESPQNLVLRAESAGVMFAGALASFGVTPLLHGADPQAMLAALEAILVDMSNDGPTTIVPGHGPVGGQADLKDLIGYVGVCIDAQGDPSAIMAGPWDRWNDRRFDAVNVERSYRMANGDTDLPQAMFALLGYE